MKTTISSVPAPSLFSYVLQEHGGVRPTEFLARMDALVPWAEIASELEPVVYDGTTGRPGFPVITLVKTLLLQQWYGLSDPEAEDQIRDRVSFQRFLGITERGDIPDETTVCRFRLKLIEIGAAEDLFAVVQQLIGDHGVRVKRGAIIDATIVDAPKGRKRSDGSSTRDTEAGFTRKHGEWRHGYKAHVRTDTQGRFIERVVVTGANVHDSQAADALIHPDDPAVFADAAYISAERKRDCRRRGIFYGITDRASRGRPLSRAQRHRNHQKSSVRCRGEHPFAWMKGRTMNHRRARYRGLLKNTAHALFVATAYNLKRLASVLALAPTAT